MKELEGVHKFRFELKSGPIPDTKYVNTLEKWRKRFYKINFIGHYQSEDVGYGNLSMKVNNNNEFVITGSQTGKHPHLSPEHYVHVQECDHDKMSVIAQGLIAPSSESLTHYSLYQANPNIQFVFHIHHEALWNMLIKNGHEGTSEEHSYGTKEIADEVKQLVMGKENGLFVMKGHQDGIMAYGNDENIVGTLLLEQYEKLKNSEERD